jgi:hypothetical protein
MWMHTNLKEKKEWNEEYRNIILQEATIKEEEEDSKVGEEEDST